MKRTSSNAIHVWLVLNKAVQAITRYAAARIQDAGLGDSDFRVLEVLLHKGSLPVNTIGPKVNLTPREAAKIAGVSEEVWHANNKRLQDLKKDGFYRDR